MIHAGLILKAITGQMIGAGALAKHGIDQARARQGERALAGYYAPLDRWWNMYGSPEAETQSKIYDACRAECDAEWIGYVCRTVTPVNAYVEDFLRHPEWTTYKNHGYPMTMLYYASMGKAARVVMFGSIKEVRRVPSGNLFSLQNPNVQEQIIKMLNDHDVPDIFWYTERVDKLMQRLNAMSGR